jgi:hypothetical protein
LLAASIVLGVLAALLFAFPARAHEAFSFKSPGWEGGSELVEVAREKLGKARVHVTATLPWDEIQPSDAVLILHPERELDYREVESFLAAGGRLGIADDYGKGDALLRRFRIHRVRAPLSPREPLRDNPNLPVAVPPRDAQAHPLVQGVDRVVTNHPSGLETDPSLRLTTVLELPAIDEAATPLAMIGVIGDAKRCGLSDSPDAPITSPAAGSASSGRCGRLVALGDPSALMNLMLRYPGNRAFATRLVEYLVADDAWGRRGGNLYLLANDFTEHGTFGHRDGLMSAIDDRIDAVSRLVAETRKEGLPGPLALLLGAVSALGAAAWAFLAATRRYRRSVPRYARPTPLVAQGGLAGRAAVLAADTTHRALAVLELKTALEESLRERLGNREASLPALIEEIDRQAALGRRNSDVLRDLVEEMTRAEHAVTRTEGIRIPGGTIRRMHQAVEAILSELDQHGARRS